MWLLIFISRRVKEIRIAANSFSNTKLIKDGHSIEQSLANKETLFF